MGAATASWGTDETVACLEESTAALVTLALRGRHAEWCHGVACDPVRMHAWIEVDGLPVDEPPSTSRYTPLLRISSPIQEQGGTR